MKLDDLKTIEAMQAFLDGSQAIAFAVASSKDERYQCVEQLLKRFHYPSLKRGDKGVMRAFLMKITGYSRQQLTRMIGRYTQTGKLIRYQKTSNGFQGYYTTEDIRLLAALDKRHETPNGLRAKKLCERAYVEFNDLAYERLAKISVSHLYNLRHTRTYRHQKGYYQKTRSTSVAKIGERRKPRPEGKPGYIRIDTVHQGDREGIKGVYHINAVDEVTQFEVVVSVEKISEAYLIPALEALLAQFPFVLHNFHSDNGSEYVNKQVAKLLKKLLMEFTRSRPRHSNDNGLVEGKNAAVVRKTFGYLHIPQQFANRINVFNQQALNPYVNYHRPCLFPTTYLDKKGKQRKKYHYKNTLTPYEKLKSLPQAEQYLKDGMTLAQLDDRANKMSDNDAADYLQQQRDLLFNEIYEDCKKRKRA